MSLLRPSKREKAMDDSDNSYDDEIIIEKDKKALSKDFGFGKDNSSILLLLLLYTLQGMYQ